MEQIEEKFSRILKYMGIPKEEIRPDASFAVDFEFNEFQFNCLVYYISNYFDISVSESDYPQLTTIGNTKNFIRNKKGLFRRSLSSVKANKGSKKAISF